MLCPTARSPVLGAAGMTLIFLTYETHQRRHPPEKLWADDAGREFALEGEAQCSGVISLLLRFADDTHASDMSLKIGWRMFCEHTL